MTLSIRKQSTTGKSGIISCAILLFLLLGGQSHGQEYSGRNDPGAKTDSPWSTFIRGGYVYQFDTDLESSDGDFTAHRFFIQPGIVYAPDRKHSYSLAVGYGYDGYDFKDANGLGVVNPWDDIHTLRLSTPIRFTQGQNWSYFIVPTLRITGESGADMADSLTGGGFAGFGYRFSERLTLGPGIGVITQIEDDVSIFPVLIINWKITETLSLETGRGVGATVGPGVTLNWKATEKWRLSVGGRYEKLRFRLDDTAEIPDGVGQDESFPVFGSITYNFHSSAQLSLIGGIETGGELRLEDSDGKFIAQEDYDSAAFLGFSFYYRF